MKSISTAEEFLRGKPFSIESIHSNMIEFAKLHVVATLEEVLENIPCLGSGTDIPTYEEMEEAVLNAYPLTNIK